MTEALEAHLRRQVEHSQRFFWHRLRWRAVRSYLPENEAFELVDVGAGAGLLGRYLEQDRPLARYRFVEPIPSLQEFLTERYGSDADVVAADRYDAKFVTLLDVLEHQEDDRTFLAELVAKMRPGATLLLTVPAHQRLWSQWDVALGHFRRYEKDTLLAVAEDLPLSVRETSFLFPEMVPLGLVRSRKKGEASTEDGAEFPDVPGVVNDVLYGLGSVSLGLRKRWPTGTSLFLAATVTG